MTGNDGELISRTLAGEQEAFTALVDRYRDAVCAVAYHHLGDFDDVQDAAQEAFVQAYLRLAQLREPSKFGPWLRRIATNVCLQALRRGGPSSHAFEDEKGQPAERADDAHRTAVRMIVRDALSRLSEKTRLTVTLSYIDGYSHAEIAGFLEVPVNTVRSRLQLAKKRLREEMIGMVSDVLHEEKPGDELTVRVMSEATRRARKAMADHSTGDAIEHYDRALAALEDLKARLEPEELKKQMLADARDSQDTTREQKRERLALLSAIPASRIAEVTAAELIWMKAGAVHFPLGVKAAIELQEQAIETFVEFAPPDVAARSLVQMGVDYSNSGNREKAESYYQRALEVYKGIDDANGQAQCLLWLGTGSLGANDFVKGRDHIEQALPLFESKPSHDWVAVCRALLEMLDEAGEERYPSLLRKAGVCEVLRRADDGVFYAGQPGWSAGGIPADAPALGIHSIIWQLRGPHHLILAAGPVGTRRSGKVFSYTKAPLRSTLRVVSDSETVTVPAGTFDRCLLIEMTRKETAPPDEDTQQRSDLNQKSLCGTRRAWFAPGVGIVQVWVRTGTDLEATIQLRESEIVQPSTDYLPLAIGNRWVYGWAGVPEEYVAKEAYRVAANAGDMYYLEHYDYVYRK